MFPSEIVRAPNFNESVHFIPIIQNTLKSILHSSFCILHSKEHPENAKRSRDTAGFVRTSTGVTPRSFLADTVSAFLTKRPKSSTSLCGSYCSQNSLVLLSESSASLSVLPRSFFRSIRRMQNFISFSFAIEKERNGHLSYIKKLK